MPFRSFGHSVFSFLSQNHLFAVTVFTMVTWGGMVRADPAKQPNIVIVLADDLGVNDLACYGRSEHRTPHLDKLASQGLRFTTAYCAQPICSPSRAAIMTGKCPARLHLTNFLNGRADAPSQLLLQPIMEGQLPLEELTIAELLKRVGYSTGLFGKWHLGGKDFGPSAQGFDTVVTPHADSTPSETEGGKSEYATADAAIAFIEKNRDRPFFCYVPQNNPHIPLKAKKELVEKYANAFNPTYAAMIETLDDATGRIIDKIDQLGISENTIIIFTSDNGGLHVLESPDSPATHNTPYRAGKGYLYEGGLREPLIVRWPAVIQKAAQIETPVVLTDLVPTLLEAAGVDIGKQVGPLDGVSLMPILRGKQIDNRDLYWHFPHYTNQGSRPAGAIRSGTWKLIEHFEDSSVELFDLSNDISETMNVADSNSDRVSELKKKLGDWRTRVGAAMPTKNADADAALHKAIYIDVDSSKILADLTASRMAESWGAWRKQMNEAVKGRVPLVTSPANAIRLDAKDAIIHAKTMRYEGEPNKNVLGYWTNPNDWAEWKFSVKESGEYEVEIQQGCGAKCGGADVHVEVADQTLSFTVIDTGHFQHMIRRVIGTVKLSKGDQSISIKPQSKPSVAVMDIRQIVLRPTKK